MPNLLKTTEDVAEDLIMAIEEILEPDEEEVRVTKSWRKSNLQIYAASEMIEKLKEF